MLKRSTTKEEQYKEFWMQLENELRFRLTKNTYEKRMVIMFDNEVFIRQKQLNNWVNDLNGKYLLFHHIIQS